MHRVVVGISAQNASATDRVILAFNPPTRETNLFWNGIGEKMASMQSLVGNDPLTGAYDNSELAAEW